MTISSLEGLSSNDPQVFINFRGSDLRNSFIGFLVTALRNASINVFTDRDELMGRSLQNLLVRIEESKLAIAIFSENYTSSVWCLDELVKIKECMDQRNLIAVPIFYKIEPSMVKHLEGKFGDDFRTLKRCNRHEPEKAQKWEEALTSIPQIIGTRLSEKSDLSDEDFIKRIVEGVQRSLANISIRENPSTKQNLQNNHPREIFLEEPAKKEKSSLEVYRHENGFSARQLEIASSEKSKKWAWHFIYDALNYNKIEVVTMIKIHWLEIKGCFNTSNLIPGTEYEVVYVLKLEESASKWKNPVYLKLKVVQHDLSEIRQESIVNLSSYIGQDWVNIRAGTFVAPDVNAAASVNFTMYQYESQMKGAKGLVVQGVALRPIR